MTVLDVSGLIIAPGFVDMHVHFRAPGFEYKEDILTGAAAAAAGGVTTCCCMPNTSPVADTAEIVKYIMDRVKQTPVQVLPYGAVTIGQKGRELTDFPVLKAAGAIALSDDGNPIQSAELARRAMKLAREHDLLIVSHCEDAEMVKNYAANEGEISRKLGLPGRPAIAEEIMVARDALLAAETGAKVHIAHVSTAGSVEIIRKAKAAGIAITAETCPQYFTLTENVILRQGSLARVNPPLRTADDAAAIIRGLADGTIDAIATDHAPHSADEKALPLAEAPSGMIGLETSLALALKFLYHTGVLSIDRIIALMSTNPARILGIGTGTLAVGDRADIVIFDPDEVWVVDPDQFKSKARNTPFAGMNLRGRVKYTISRGEVVYSSYMTND
jgi:dihydroorotase